jgi:solute carrier family 45, member 1/2/4
MLVQSMDRALIVDTLPSSEQPSANAWAARMLGIGGVGGFFLYVHYQCLMSMLTYCCAFLPSGGIDMTSILPFLGKTELQVLSVLGATILVATHLTTAAFVKERTLISSL